MDLQRGHTVSGLTGNVGQVFLQLQNHWGHGHKPRWARDVNTEDTHLLLPVKES